MLCIMQNTIRKEISPFEMWTQQHPNKQAPTLKLKLATPQKQNPHLTNISGTIHKHTYNGCNCRIAVAVADADAASVSLPRFHLRAGICHSNPI